MTKANWTMEQNTTEGNILDVKGVCQLFRIGRDEVYRLVHSGRLPVMRFGKHGKTWRFYLEDLLKLREEIREWPADVVNIKWRRR